MPICHDKFCEELSSAQSRVAHLEATVISQNEVNQQIASKLEES